MALYLMLFNGHSETGESGTKTQMMFKGTLEVVPEKVAWVTVGVIIGAIYRGDARLSRLSLGFSPISSLRYKPRPSVMHFC